MREKIKLIGFYNYTVILTYIGMLIGFMGIMLVLKNNHVWALICLMIAGVCDMFDGTIASTKKDRTKDEKSFGIQIDSLSDLICFGVLPSVWVMSMSDKLGVLSLFHVFLYCVDLSGLHILMLTRRTVRRQHPSADPIISDCLLRHQRLRFRQFT